ncbi:hypothetical protein EVAR_51112_1 [Eumeta japonica]|uniref:Uncharacterized protein n=1 Tax=Eumeta variegata TaxID=151549 RepID=A0A4C1YCW9_EUMVA|nr:hypothetical protein EVAR_51112_1 [Eumeta japonica]
MVDGKTEKWQDTVKEFHYSSSDSNSIVHGSGARLDFFGVRLPGAARDAAPSPVKIFTRAFISGQRAHPPKILAFHMPKDKVDAIGRGRTLL